MGFYRFQVVLERDEDGMYVADVPALQGCHTQEALENIKDAIAVCLAELRDEGAEILS